MILSQVKRLLQTVEEASCDQVAADLGADRGMTEAALEHLVEMGKVVRCHREELAAAADCGERVVCSGCPLVSLCDPGANCGAPGYTAGGVEEEQYYAWASN